MATELLVGSLVGKKIIALDLGRRTGWAVYAPKSKIERGRDSGVYELYPEASRKQEDAITDADRFVSLGRFLTALDDAIGGADVVAFEQVDGGTKGRQTVLYNGYRAIVLEWSARLGKVPYPVPVHTIKRVYANRGAASKEEVIAAAVAHGYLPFDDNEADAIACLHTTIRLSKSPGALEREVETAKSMDLGQFKSKPVVVKKRPKRAKKGLSLVNKQSNVDPIVISDTPRGPQRAPKNAGPKGQRQPPRNGNRKPKRRSRREGKMGPSPVSSN